MSTLAWCDRDIGSAVVEDVAPANNYRYFLTHSVICRQSATCGERDGSQ